MFDIEDDDDLAEVCRDEFCDLDYVHPSHVYKLRPPAGRAPTPWWLKTEPEGHRRVSSKGLRAAMQRAFEATDRPLAFVDVRNAVWNDYGSAPVRTLHRHVRRMINANFIRELDLELSHAAYIRSDSRYLGDREGLREYLMGRHAQFNERPRDRPRPTRRVGLIGVGGLVAASP